MLRRKPLIVLAVLAALAVLYGAAWLAVSQRVAAQIVSWAESRRADGWRIAWTGLSVEGFPFHLRARIDGVEATVPGPARRTLSAPVLYARFAPWRPRQAMLEAPTAARVDWEGVAPGRVTFGHATATAMFDAAGRPQKAILLLDDAAVAMPADGAPARITRITATAAAGGGGDSGVRSHRRLVLAVRGEMKGLTLPEGVNPALGRTLARLALEADLLGEPPPGPGAAAMAAWRDGGGTVEVKSFALGWGPLKAEGDGTLALDSAMQPEGALTARISGFDRTVETLVEAGIVPARHGVLLGYALNALARRPADGGPPVIEAPVTLQGGRLYIGPVALMPLPRIDWK